MEQDLREEGAARARHVVHVLPSDDVRVSDAVRSLVERIEAGDAGETGEGGGAGPGLRLLVLTPSADEVAPLAALVNDGLDAAGPLLTPVADVRRGARRIAAAPTAILTTPELAKALVAKSLLKLDAITAVMLVQLDVLVARQAELLEGVMGEVAKGADRMATAEVMSPAVDEFLDRHARKARRMSYDLAIAAESTTEYLVCDLSQRNTALANLLASIDPDHATVVASEDDAEAACAALAQLGHGPDDALVSFSDGECPAAEPLVVLFTTPADPGELAEIVAAEPKRIVTLVAPEDLAAFRRVFGKGARPLTTSSAPAEAATSVEKLRATLRGVLAAGGLHHEVLALAPLFVDHDAAEVAAAALRLLESQVVIPAPRFAAHREERAPMAEAPRARRTATPEAAPQATPSGKFTSLFITIGEKDGARKGDLVGAISNEAGISSELLGKITMRDTFSVVEVDASVADRVIETLNGKTIRGRIVAARIDRSPDRTEGAGRPPRRAPMGGARGGRDDRPRRSFRDDSAAGGSRGGFGGARGRPARAGDSDRPRRSPPRDEAGGPRTFRDGDRGRTPRAMDESRQWRDRGEQLRNTRRPRRGDA